MLFPGKRTHIAAETLTVFPEDIDGNKVTVGGVEQLSPYKLAHESYKYVGIEVSESHNLEKQLDRIKTTLDTQFERVMPSPGSDPPTFKTQLHLFRTYYLAALAYSITTVKYPFGCLKFWTGRMTAAASSLLGLPQSIASPLFHLPTKMGGLGIPDLRMFSARVYTSFFVEKAYGEDTYLRLLAAMNVKTIEDENSTGARPLHIGQVKGEKQTGNVKARAPPTI